MPFQWLASRLPNWRWPTSKKAPPQASRSHSARPSPVKIKPDPDPIKRIKGSRITKSKSRSPVNVKFRHGSSSEGSITPPIDIYSIPVYQPEESELSSAGVVTTPSGSDSSLDSDERYQPKHKIKENITEFDFEREAQIQREELLIKQHSGLTALEVKLFNQISMVGLEPLLPRSWQHDFPTFPDPMFIDAANPEAPMPFVCESHGSEYAGKSISAISFTTSTSFLPKTPLFLDPSQHQF